MMRARTTALFVATAVLCVFALTPSASADRGRRILKADLEGFQEVPAVSTTGTGEFRARVNDGSSVDFELTYENLQGTTTTAAHIHIGQEGVNGGVVVFLCGGGGRPACTPTNGSFSGTFGSADVLAVPAQGIAAGELDEVLEAMRRRVAYVNVHTTPNHPGGEIRGQIK